MERFQNFHSITTRHFYGSASVGYSARRYWYKEKKFFLHCSRADATYHSLELTLRFVNLHYFPSYGSRHLKPPIFVHVHVSNFHFLT